MECLQISEDHKVHLIHSSLQSRGVLAHLKSTVWQQIRTDFNTETEEEEDIETSIRNAMQQSGVFESINKYKHFIVYKVFKDVWYSFA